MPGTQAASGGIDAKALRREISSFDDLTHGNDYHVRARQAAIARLQEIARELLPAAIEGRAAGEEADALRAGLRNAVSTIRLAIDLLGWPAPSLPEIVGILKGSTALADGPMAATEEDRETILRLADVEIGKAVMVGRPGDAGAWIADVLVATGFRRRASVAEPARG